MTKKGVQVGEAEIVIRKVQEIGTTPYIALPVRWLRDNNISKGDELLLLVGDVIVIIPVKKLTTIKLL